MRFLAVLPLAALTAAHFTHEGPTTDLPPYTEPTTTLPEQPTTDLPPYTEPTTTLPEQPTTDLPPYTEPTTTLPEEPTTDLPEYTDPIVSVSYPHHTHTWEKPPHPTETEAPTSGENPETTLVTVTSTFVDCPVYPNSTITGGPVPPTTTASGGGPGPTTTGGGGPGGPAPNAAATMPYMDFSVLAGLVGVVVLVGLM